MATQDGSMWNFPSSLTHSGWVCGIATVWAIGASVRSGWALADEGVFPFTRHVIPFKVGIFYPHLDTVLILISVIRLT